MKINIKKLRSYIRNMFLPLYFSLLFFHILLYLFHKNKKLIDKDLTVWRNQSNIKAQGLLAFIFLIRFNKYYRNVFYYRIGPFYSYWLNLIFPKEKSFIISPTVIIGGGFYVLHPYSTIINAKYIGSNCIIRHLSTFGNKEEDNSKIPCIEDNVVFGANVNVIGDIVIGNNSIIGAGAVITKNVPSFSVVVGNPAFIIKEDGIKTNRKL